MSNTNCAGHIPLQYAKLIICRRSIQFVAVRVKVAGEGVKTVKKQYITYSIVCYLNSSKPRLMKLGIQRDNDMVPQ